MKCTVCGGNMVPVVVNYIATWECPTCAQKGAHLEITCKEDCFLYNYHDTPIYCLMYEKAEQAPPACECKLIVRRHAH